MDSFAQQAGEVKESEYPDRGDENQASIKRDEFNQRILIAGQYCFVNDSFGDEGGVGIDNRHHADGDQKTHKPTPMRPRSAKDAQESPAVELSSKLFFFEFELRHC